MGQKITRPSNLIRTLAIATTINRLTANPDRGTDTAGFFQRVGVGILRCHRQRVLALGQTGRKEQRERGGVVDGDLVIRQFRGGTLGVGQHNAHHLVVTNHLQHRATDEEVVARRRAAILQARLTILGL